MKKILPGLALLAPLAGLVHAQSNVSISGTVDGGVRDQTYADTSGGKKISMSSNGYYSSNKLDIIGHEDLGGGNHASFILESGFNLGTGQLDNTTNTLFNRQAFVQLDGAAGALSLGRQYTISHDFILVFDPFSFHFTPLIPLTRASDGTRYNNDVKYVKSFGPFKLEVENAFGEVPGNSNQGSSRSAGLMLNTGGLSVGVEISRRNIPVGTVYHNDNYYLVGAAYVAGPWKISGGVMTDEIVNTAPQVNTKTRDSFGGASYRLSSLWTLTGGYYLTDAPSDKAQRRGLTIVAVDYAFSKRTKLYIEADHTRYRRALVSTLNTAGAPRQRALTIGLNHRF
jgi:predicted porin